MSRPRRLVDSGVARLCRLLLNTFYRRVEVIGLERLPRDRPVVVVANHVNGLVDPLALLATLPIRPRFLAKSTLWDMALMRVVFALVPAIPVYRSHDEGVDTSKNVDMFRACFEVLAAGGSIAIFPEGISHNEPALAPLKTGAARIVLGAEERSGPLGTTIVPIGLTFEDKGKFRSRALLEVGEPIDPAPEIELHRRDPVSAARTLTRRIDRGLKAVTLNYESWEEAALIGRAADLFGRRRLDLPRGRRLSEERSLHAAFIEGYPELRRRYPDEVAAAAEAVRSYDRLLAATRVTDEQVASNYALPSVLSWLVRIVPRLVLPALPALLGGLLNYLPYRVVGWVSERSTDEEDQEATYKILPAILLYPFAWLIEAALAAWLAGPWLTRWGAALATLVAAPLTGWVALRHRDRLRRAVFEIGAYLKLRTRRSLAEELRQRRTVAADRVEELAARYRE